MSLELLNTSAPRGLRPGSTGFCTVGMTAGVSPALEERLTLLSGYRWLNPPGESGGGNNPVAYSHWRIMAGGRTQSILSRVCDAGFDYSRRSNRFAHHVVIESAEQAEPGPAWVMMQPGVMRTSWAGEPMAFPEGPDIPKGHATPRVCTTWAGASGDAGWAGVLAEAFARDPSRVAWIIYPRDMEVLPLVDEAIELLPPPRRWQVTFCTYFSDLPAGLDCAWRFCPAGSRSAADAARQPGAGLLIDLTQAMPPPPESAYVKAAREGLAVVDAADSPAVVSNENKTPRAERYDAHVPFDPSRYGVAPDATVSITQFMPSAPGTTNQKTKQAAPGAISDTLKDNGIGDPPVSLYDKDTGEPPRSARAFWVLAIAWPLIVAGGVVAYLHTRSNAQPASQTTAIAPVAPVPGPAQPATQAVEDASIATIAGHPATTQALPTQAMIDDRDRTIAQLRDAIAEMKDDLASARIRAQGGAAAQTELDALKIEYASLQKKLTAAMTQPTTPPATIDHTVELFRDEVELWPGDGNGPPDLLQLDSYKPPETLLVERSAGQIALKSIASTAASGPAVPVELAIITIDGQRVVLKWITPNRAAVSAPIRTWLQLARLTISRQGHIVGAARFAPPRSADINVDHETPASLLPDIHSKEALAHIGLAVPTALPQGWTARLIDGQTVTLVSSAATSATFDVQLTVTPAGEVEVQTTYSIAVYRQIQASQNPATTPAGKKAADDAAAVLRGMPALSVPVVNRENGLVLISVRMRRGE